jgi:hypothetical protein
MNGGVQNADRSGGTVRVVGPGRVAGAAVAIEILGKSRLDLSDVTVAGNTVRVVGGRITLTNVTMTGNAVYALQATRIDADGLVVSDNPGQGIGTTRIDGRNVTVTNNGSWEIYVLQHAVFESLTASGNGLVGLRCDRCRPRLKSSTLTGNDASEIGIDLQSRGKPRLIASSCGKSLGLGTGPWGVCLDD